jgi:prepilin-type N-terminal cleavage/methylation domain-containing protein
MQKGFTLIESLLYLTIAAIILTAMSTLLTIALQARVKSQAIAEVEQVGSRALHLIAQTIRNAESINSPSVGNSASTLSLSVSNATNNPTIFNLAGYTLQITEGSKSAIALNSTSVLISNLSFKNFSATNTSGIIQIQFTAMYNNPENRQEYDYTKTFITSASLR